MYILFNPEILPYHLKGKKEITDINKDLAIKNVLHSTVYNRKSCKERNQLNKLGTPTHNDDIATKINKGGGVGLMGKVKVQFSIVSKKTHVYNRIKNDLMFYSSKK